MGFQRGIEKGDFSLADQFIALAREFHPSSRGLQGLIQDIERERISLKTRQAYQDGRKAFSMARLEDAEKCLKEALKGANDHYKKRIEPRLEYLSGRLYLKYRIMGFRSYNEEKWARAGQYLLKCLNRKKSGALEKLVGNQILPKVTGSEKEEIRTQLEGLKKGREDRREREKWMDAKLADQNLSSLSDYRRAIQAYEKFLSKYPHKIYAQTVRERIGELKREVNNIPPSITGFTYLRTATYSAGGQTHTVKEYRHDATGLEFVLIPGGSFRMGDTNWNDSQPVHTVTLKPFLISKTEVTQKVYEKIMGTNPSLYKGDNKPVEHVSWNDAKIFCQKAGLSLPSEAQWEYACRAGTTTAFYWGGSAYDYMWYDSNSGGTTHSVGQKKPNAYGLYDMLGNVWEWVEDNWHSNYNGAPTDGTAWYDPSDSGRVRRGGSWRAGVCRSGYRYSGGTVWSYGILGFRPARPVSDN